MINNPDTDVDPLLRPLPDAQQALIRIVGEAVLDTGAWPTYQYVEAKLDDRGYDVDAVFGGLPYITHNSLTYSLVRRDRTGREDEPVKLTIAGMAHLPSLASTVSMSSASSRRLAPDGRARHMNLAGSSQSRFRVAS